MAKNNKKRKKKIKKVRMARNLLAVVAWFRNSAGRMKDKCKEESVKHCRRWKQGKMRE